MQTQISSKIRQDWQVVDILAIYQLPLPDLFFRAQTVHREFHDPNTIQGCILLSIKTGGCPEDCGYCPQSSHYETNLERQPLLSVDETLQCARQAADQGATRFCMGAPGAVSLTEANSKKFLKWFEGFAKLGWKPVARWACCPEIKRNNSPMLA